MNEISHQLLETRFPDSQARLEAELKESGRWEGELVHQARDGREVVVQSRWTLRRDLEGRPAAVLEINSDVTERKRAEAEREELLAIAERARADAESAAAAIQAKRIALTDASARAGTPAGSAGSSD